MNVETFFGKVAREFDPCPRGDAITGERYWSREFMAREWKQMWTRVWHVGGAAADLAESGDYAVHNIGPDSVIMIRQKDGRIRAFFNVCQHRGNRLAWSELGSAGALTCAYHGWRWGLDGNLEAVQDADDFEGGSPCGKLKLKEIPCDIWAGLIWFNMDPGCPPLKDFLHPLPDQLEAYRMDEMVRVVYRTIDLKCNWKIIPDNFNEAYHIPTLHPQLLTFIDDDCRDTHWEMFPTGHTRMIQKGAHPSGRLSMPDQMRAPLDSILRFWELNPEDFRDRARDARAALKAQKRKLWKVRGFHHYQRLDDSQLTDYFEYTLFPNITMTFMADGVHFFRSEPHPHDPERCIFDYWFFTPRIEGQATVDTQAGARPVVAAEREHFTYDGAPLFTSNMDTGDFLEQDLSIAVGQQKGLHSLGFERAHLSRQEKRVQRFHETLNDYLDGKR